MFLLKDCSLLLLKWQLSFPLIKPTFFEKFTVWRAKKNGIILGRSRRQQKYTLQALQNCRHMVQMKFLPLFILNLCELDHNRLQRASRNSASHKCNVLHRDQEVRHPPFQWTSWRIILSVKIQCRLLNVKRRRHHKLLQVSML